MKAASVGQVVSRGLDPVVGAHRDVALTADAERVAAADHDIAPAADVQIVVGADCCKPEPATVSFSLASMFVSRNALTFRCSARRRWSCRGTRLTFTFSLIPMSCRGTRHRVMLVRLEHRRPIVADRDGLVVVDGVVAVALDRVGLVAAHAVRLVAADAGRVVREHGLVQVALRVEIDLLLLRPVLEADLVEAVDLLFASALWLLTVLLVGSFWAS